MTQLDMRDTGSGLYIHVPFCSSKCDYCGFYSIVGNELQIAQYLQRLHDEVLERFTADTPKFKTVFVGGGNPTCLGLNGLKKLCEIVLPYVEPSATFELTFESNPETLSSEMVAFFADLPGIRLSMGVQRLLDSELQILGRAARLAAIYRALDLACASLDNVGIDLILGVPGCDSIAADLQKIVATYPLKHLSAYFLTIEPETPMQIAIAQGLLVSPENIGPEELFAVRDVLAQKGFEHYEISNYSQPGYGSKHNLNYWKPGNYTGLGPSAVSTCVELRCTNPADLNRWLAAEGPVVEHLSPVDRRNEFVMLRLRLLKEGLSISALERRFGTQSQEFFTELAGFVADGLLTKVDDNIVVLTDRGIIMADNVMSSLFL